MDKVSKAVLGLKPVTFRYKDDNANAPQFGLIAEQVEQVSPDLVLRNAKGEITSVRYDAVNAMLLNEFLKEHKKVEEQQTILTQLKTMVVQQQKRFAKQEEHIEALSSSLQEVSRQLQVRKSATQFVAINE